MKIIDIRFSDSDTEKIKIMIGKKMEKYKCDPFIYSSSVYGVVGISVDGKAFSFTNFVEVMDYFGEIEDVAVFKINETNYESIHSMIQGQEMVETDIDGVIVSVTIINENQRLFENDNQLYDVWLTRGIIFKFEDGRELSLEKSIWFSEDISVERGYNLIERFSSTEEFSEGFEKPYRGESYREIITLK